MGLGARCDMISTTLSSHDFLRVYLLMIHVLKDESHMLHGLWCMSTSISTSSISWSQDSALPYLSQSASSGILAQVHRTQHTLVHFKLPSTYATLGSEAQLVVLDKSYLQPSSSCVQALQCCCFFSCQCRLCLDNK